MSFIEDFKKMNVLTENQLHSLMEFLNSTVEEGNQKSPVLDNWCTENNMTSELFNISRSIIILLIRRFIIENGFDKGIQLFEQDLLEIRNCDDDVISAWNKLKPVLSKLEDYSLKIKSDVLENKYPNLEDISLTCDVRPVLNLNCTEIKRLLFPIILTIKLSNSDEDIIFECNETELNDIKEKIEKAINKIEIIKKSIKIG